MTYFLDNNLSPKYADMLRALDVDAIHLKRHYPESMPDEEWIPEIGAKGWVLISGDRNIRTKPH